MVNSVVWLIKYDTLSDLMQRGVSTISTHGEHRLVTGQSSDKRRVEIKPPLKDAAEGSAPESYICILLADVHQYVYLYENFKATAKRLQETSSSVPVPEGTTEAQQKTEHFRLRPDNVVL